MAFPTGQFRGGIAPTTGTLYGAWKGELWTVNDSGEVTLFSTNLAGTGFVHFGRNNASIPNTAVVTSAGALIIDTTTNTVTAYPDADVGSPSCMCGYLGYLFFGYGDGTLRSTNYNTTDINSLNQANTASNPDGILNVFGYAGQLYAMGDATVEIWGEPINATGFPLSRVGFNILPGIIGPHAVAGWEPEFGNPPIWVGSDGTVRQLQGYQAAKISNADIDRDINRVAAIDRSKINALCYISGGHAFWQMNLPTKSWVYHVNEGAWHERTSQYSTRSRIEKSVFFGSKWLVGDTDSANLDYIDIDSDTEAGAEIPAQMISGPLKEFPRRQRVDRADFDFTVGIGKTTGTDPMQTDPEALIEVSYDGGKTWPYSWERKLGKEGKTYRRVYVLNAGLTGDEGARWRWTVSDPVHVGFLGGDVDTKVHSK